MRVKRFCFVLLVDVTPVVFLAQVRNYYVSTTGSDSSGGLTPSTAWATLTHASNAISLGRSGTVVHVAPGSYHGNVKLSNAVPGTASALVTYVSDTKWGAVLVGSQTQPGVIYDNEPYSVVKNFAVTGTSCIGIQLDNSHQSAVGNNVYNAGDNCESSGHSGVAGIASTNHGVGVGYNSATGNFLHDVGMNSTNPTCVPNNISSLSSGIYWQNPYGVIDNNLVVHVCGDGIATWHGASHELIINNTAVDCRNGIELGSGDDPCNNGTTGCPGGNDYTFIFNNIATNQNLYGIYTTYGHGGSMGTHNQVSYNLLYNNNTNFRLSGTNVTCSPGCISGQDPLFVNNTGTAAGDYHLRSGSPAIGAGTTVGAPATDFDGLRRTASITVGAYQGAQSPTSRSSRSSPVSPNRFGTCLGYRARLID